MFAASTVTEDTNMHSMSDNCAPARGFLTYRFLLEGPVAGISRFAKKRLKRLAMQHHPYSRFMLPKSHLDVPIASVDTFAENLFSGRNNFGSVPSSV
jgi:hypothetical protein